ncbi:trehalose-phosphatase [Herpetosiphon giganteus]|uniref:trehalose-phosphatase n=1 Tax=Herpetosiphon giganteus TaxID=2029754 RepID=UPI00195E6EC7|nr:trehalose-phosphatase [Herpetosiphon giganteus]MBM7844459.1 trehalose 6-phosphate phosphatase [Herpetosiphon giganteus]
MLSTTLKQRLQPIIAVERLGLITDIDGTISRIAPTPDGATVDPLCRAALSQLSEHLPLVAAVSGRAARDVQRMLQLPAMRYIGNHGLEVWGQDGGVLVPAAQPFSAAVREFVVAMERYELPEGVVLESKGITATLHYRLATDQAAAEAWLRKVLGELASAHNLIITEGLMIFEVRPPVSWHKGSAVGWLIDDQKLDAAIFFGDDLTDVDGFRAIAAARKRGCQAVAIGVINPESHPSVAETADICIDGVGSTAEVLQWILEQRLAQVQATNS